MRVCVCDKLSSYREGKRKQGGGSEGGLVVSKYVYLTMFLKRCVSERRGFRWKTSGSNLFASSEARNLTAERIKLAALSAWGGKELA